MLETLLRIALIVLVAYVGVCLLLYLVQDRLIFFPQPLQREPVGPHVHPATVERPDATLRGWVVNGQSNGPLLFYFQGNAEEVSTLAGRFADLDAVTVLMNYRGYGESGGKPTTATVVDDAVAIVANMRARFGADRPVVLFGRSLGSGVAALTARGGGIDGVILMSPYRSLEHIARRRYPFAPVGWMLRQNIDTTLAIDALPQPVLVLYAARDRVVPTSESRALLGLLKSAPEVVEFVGPHGIALETPELWAAIKAFVQRAGGTGLARGQGRPEDAEPVRDRGQPGGVGPVRDQGRPEDGDQPTDAPERRSSRGDDAGKSGRPTRRAGAPTTGAELG